MEKVLLLLLLILVKSEDVMFPEECDRSPTITYRRCCIFPPFFVAKIAKECGAVFEFTFEDATHNVTGFKRYANSECYHWDCMLRKYHLVDADNITISIDKYYKHLDRWVELNPAFFEVMKKGKIHCKNKLVPYLPLETCDFVHIHSCIRNFVICDCPVSIPTPECVELKEFYDKCRFLFL